METSKCYTCAQVRDVDRFLCKNCVHDTVRSFRDEWQRAWDSKKALEEQVNAALIPVQEAQKKQVMEQSKRDRIIQLHKRLADERKLSKLTMLHARQVKTSNNARRNELRVALTGLASYKQRLHAMTSKKEKLSAKVFVLNQLVSHAQHKLINKLLIVCPITPLEAPIKQFASYSIASVPVVDDPQWLLHSLQQSNRAAMLPGYEHFDIRDILSAGLGLIVWLLSHLARYLNCSLPFVLSHHGSRSTIHSNLLADSILGGSEHDLKSKSSSSSSSAAVKSHQNEELPLYYPTNEFFIPDRFERALLLLDRNVSHLCVTMGTRGSVLRPRRFLHNLYQLITHVNSGVQSNETPVPTASSLSSSDDGFTQLKTPHVILGEEG